MIQNTIGKRNEIIQNNMMCVRHSEGPLRAWLASEQQGSEGRNLLAHIQNTDNQLKNIAYEGAASCTLLKKDPLLFRRLLMGDPSGGSPIN